MNSLDQFATSKLDVLTSQALRRALETSVPAPGQIVERHGKRLVSFCSNDYLGLSHDRRVLDAAAEALTRYGAGAGASRLVTGNHPELMELEREIASWKEAEAALVFGSGYLANVGAIPVLAEHGDVILIDELAHACQIAGARLSKARVVVFRHNDVAHLEELLAQHRPAARHCLIVSEGLFSMDGDLAPLPDIARVARRYDAWTYIDDAHALGVIGEGHGSSRHWGVKPDVQMGTLSKAAGSYGGYIAANRAVVDLLVSRASSFIFATGLPPASAAAARAALGVMRAEPALCSKPLRFARTFAVSADLPEPHSCIVPVIFGSAEAALAASAALARQGFLATAIRPPTVPEGASRVRFTFCADHQEADVLRLADAVRSLRASSLAA